MNSSAEQLARQTGWGISGADVITGDTLVACVAEASGLARWLGLRCDVALPAPAAAAARATSASQRDASARACPAA